MGIFKTYDIRGIYGQDIDAGLAYKIGRAFARFLQKDRYMVGYDARSHSQELYQALSRGLVDEGKRVTGIGRASTPQLHFFQIQEGCDGGAMVTASHNPPQYHGFKLYDGRGGSVSYARGLNKIQDTVAGMGQDLPVKRGSFSEVDMIDEYIDFVSEPLKGEKITHNIVIDPGNGSSGRVFRKLSKKLNLNAVIINEEPDGEFPNRDPNPLKPESKEMAALEVRRLGADFGAILDGDGDRILFVDERGEGIENFFISALVAEELLDKNPGAAIAYDLISSRALPERILELGGKPVVSKVGYTFLYDNMIASGAVFGSEASGHVYFKVADAFYTESAAYALVFLLKLLKKSGKKLSELVEPLKQRYFQSPEINIEVPDKDEVLKQVEAQHARAKISKLDGISVEYSDYWFNIRPSNTEPVIRLRLEAVSREVAETRTGEITSFLRSLGLGGKE